MKKLLLATTLTIYSLSGKAQQCDTLESKATFYHPKYNGRKCANGDIYSDRKATAASNDYPLGTKLMIINKTTGQTVTVVVNDRMALWIRDRIDLSRFAFRKIASISQGIQKVSIVQVL